MSASGGGPVRARSTERLLLRAFTNADRQAFAAMNADPRVMKHYPVPLSRAASDAFVDRIQATWVDRGFGLCALEHRASAAFLGYTELWPVPDEVPVRDRRRPCVEVGWRLAHRAWGRGYATEAAREALRFGADVLDLPEVVSFAAAAAAASPSP